MSKRKSKKKRKYKKPLSLYPLTPEDAIKISLAADTEDVKKKLKEDGIEIEEKDNNGEE